MAAKKTLAKGSTVVVDATTIGRIEETDIPDVAYRVLEAPELNPQDDAGNATDIEQFDLGDEEPSEGTFVHYWDPSDSGHTALDTKLAAKAEVTMQVVTSHSPALTREFPAKLVGFEQERISRDGYFKRTVRWRRTGDITDTLAVA